MAQTYNKSWEKNGYGICTAPGYLQYRPTQEIYDLASLHDLPIVRKMISWQAFPKRIKSKFGDDPTSLTAYKYVEQPGWPPKNLDSDLYKQPKRK